MSRILLALGGNALGNTSIQQKENVKITADIIVSLVKKGHELIVSHGNGPQVGIIHNAFEISNEHDPNVEDMPFSECSAMSQGYIGYHLQQAITNCLIKEKIPYHCASVITQVIVDKNDAAFEVPTKPIGVFLTKDKATLLEKSKGYHFISDSNRGYRRVVPSPMPQQIVEETILEELVNQKNIVIAAGGGGIPVIQQNDELVGIDAVIDKDLSSEMLAVTMNCDIFLVLTAVNEVSIHFNQPNQEALREVTVEKMEEYMEENQFGVGSMLPKVQACIKFVKTTHKPAIITSLEKAVQALDGIAGTKVIG
jgi:carbamate kinase